MKLKNILILCAIALIISGTVGTCSSKKIGSTDTATTEITEAPAQTPAPVRTLTLTATGDCTFATDINASVELGFVTYAEEYGNDYFMENVRSIFSEDDLTLINFEGTLSDRGEREDKQFAFRGDPSYVGILTGSSIEAANLANNHSSDYGSVSLTDTKQYLDEAGILNCRGKDNVCVTDINNIKVGLVGINYL